MPGSHLVLRGDARRIPLAYASVDLIVTSPPYWAQRSYRDAGGHYDGQIGSESHPRLWLEAMYEVMKECWRVLAPGGSVFVNLGDKRAGSGGHNNSGIGGKSGATSLLAGRSHTTERDATRATRRNAPDRYEQAHFGRRKSRQLLPERFAIGCEDGLADPEGIGWIVRQVIVWQKANGLPESVTDRTRDDFEYIYHLTKSAHYFAAIDEIREPHVEPKSSHSRKNGDSDSGPDAAKKGSDGVGRDQSWVVSEREYNPLGKVSGSVWRIASEPLRIPDWAKEKYGLPDHFACLDADTEILTRRGWLQHVELEVGDQVAGYNLDSGMAEWTGCHAVHRYDYDGPLVAVEKRDLSMRLTPNHRCLASRMTHPTNARGPLEVVMAEDLTPRHFIPRSVEFAPEPATKAIGEDMAALCGWVAAEGWYAGRVVRLSQSKTANPEKVAAIDALLERFGEMPARTERDRTYCGRGWVDVMWRLPYALGIELQRLMPAKLLTCELANLPAEEARALLEAFIDGDGHRRPDGRTGIFQKERGNLDWLQMVAVRLGYKTTLRRGSNKWVLYLTPGGRSVTLRSTNGVNKPVPREHYRGIVWCPTTGTGTFVARRNGSVFVTGNSFPTEIPRRLILGFSPSGICTACNEPRRPVVEKRLQVRNRNVAPQRYAETPPDGDMPAVWSANTEFQGSTEATITGYACRCPDTSAPTRNAVILDVFGGTGTTALVAETLGRTGISLDLSADYCNLARWRIEESHHGRKAEQRTWAEAQGTML